MEKRSNKEKLELRPELKIAFKEDAILYNQLLKSVLLAIEIADKSQEEAKEIQKRFLLKTL